MPVGSAFVGSTNHGAKTFEKNKNVILLPTCTVHLALQWFFLSLFSKQYGITTMYVVFILYQGLNVI